jgi:hypothetical protein
VQGEREIEDGRMNTEGSTSWVGGRVCTLKKKLEERKKKKKAKHPFNT